MAANEPMWSAKDFHLGADVHASDGVEVGKLVHVLVAADYSLQALVVKEGAGFAGRRLAPGSLLIADEVIVPKEAVKAVTHDRVDLSANSSAVRRMPPYLSYREKGESVAEEAEDFAGVLGSGPEIPNWLEQVANKPDSELEIDGGEPVMLGRSGKRLGSVKDVLFDGDQLVGVVLRPEGLFKKEVILPRRFLDRSDDAALFAQLDEKDVEHLSPFANE
ncbi:MAG TPA: PRC-barrel domain-containing protein [Candidatus Dormibacteraeota bacterium]|nr:PRC-barrel domain-containing protein [Candidatus Dormibacteraeota bacterium]